MPYISVHVEMSDFSDEDIAEEHRERQLPDDHPAEDLQALYYAFYFGQDEHAMQLARKIAQDATGRVLP